MGVVEEEDVVDGWAALEGMGGGGADGGVGVAGEVEGDVFGAGGGGGGDGGGVVECGEALVGLLAAAEEEGGHEEDAGAEAPKEDALVAGDHCGAPAARRARLRQEAMAAVMALAMFCW